MQLSHKRERILAIDMLRGYFLFVMIIDHLGRFPGIFDFLTGQGVLWVSAAEGFFFVSGMMVGLVRGRNMLDKPMARVSQKLLSRAVLLYFWAIGLTIIFSLVGFSLINNPGLKDGLANGFDIRHLIWSSITFQYNYGWADFLQHYAIYLFLSPIAIWLLRKKMWFLIITASILVWLLRGKNIYMTWQILFFAGTVVGYYLRDIEDFFGGLPKTLQRISLSVLAASTIVTMLASVMIVHGRVSPFLMPFHSRLQNLYDLTSPYFYRPDMPLPRLLLFALWFVAFYAFLRKYEKKILNLVGDFFVPLGQNSLYVYIMQAIIVFFLDLVIARNTKLITNAIINATVVFVIWLMVKRRFLFSFIPR